MMQKRDVYKQKMEVQLRCPQRSCCLPVAAQSPRGCCIPTYVLTAVCSRVRLGWQLYLQRHSFLMEKVQGLMHLQSAHWGLHLNCFPVLELISIACSTLSHARREPVAAPSGRTCPAKHGPLPLPLAQHVLLVSIALIREDRGSARYAINVTGLNLQLV